MASAKQVRPRYPRIGAAGSALLVTMVALLGGIGVLPTDSPAAADTARAGDQVALTTLTIPDATRSPVDTDTPTRAPAQAPVHGRFGAAR